MKFESNKRAFRCVVLILITLVIFAFYFYYRKIYFSQGGQYRGKCNLQFQLVSSAFDFYYKEYGHPIPSCLYDDEGKPMHSWRVLLLPFLGEKELYKQYDFSEAWNGPNNSKLHDKMPDIFRCPSMKFSTSYPSYLFVISEHDNSVDKNDTSRQKYLLIETNNNSINWLKPQDFPAINFDYGYSRRYKKDQKLCRLTSHRLRMSNDKLIHVTAASKNGSCFLITEDSDPEALKLFARENGERDISIVYPDTDNMYLRKIVLKEP